MPDGDYIRYFELQAGIREDPLVCSPFISATASAPTYEAISYVWGSEVKPHTLVVTCDNNPATYLYITENLYEALMTIRRVDRPRRLWADSICIDQGNLEERGY